MIFDRLNKAFKILGVILVLSSFAFAVELDGEGETITVEAFNLGTTGNNFTADTLIGEFTTHWTQPVNDFTGESMVGEVRWGAVQVVAARFQGGEFVEIEELAKGLFESLNDRLRSTISINGFDIPLILIILLIIGWLALRQLNKDIGVILLILFIILLIKFKDFIMSSIGI